jgi:hypothetical protein
VTTWPTATLRSRSRWRTVTTPVATRDLESARKPVPGRLRSRRQQPAWCSPAPRPGLGRQRHARDHSSEAIAAYRVAIDNRRRLVARQRSAEPKQAWLHGSVDLPSGATTALAAADRPAEAARAVEETRSLLLIEAMRLRQGLAGSDPGAIGTAPHRLRLSRRRRPRRLGGRGWSGRSGCPSRR